ncbi:hypothetical protein EsH8_IX_000364 [Colletotrichum jinshuiense]
MDEGIGLPVSAVHFHDQLARGAEPKELDYSEEDLTYVAESLYDDWTDQDFQGVLNLELEMHCERVETMTPPLVAPPLGESDDEGLFIPSTEVCEIEPFSEPESLLSLDLAEVRKNLGDFYDDMQLLDASTSDAIGIPSDTPSLEDSIIKPHVADLKMEVPVLHQSDMDKSSSQEDDVFRSHINCFPLGEVRGEQEGLPFDDDESSFNEQFNILLEDNAENMTRRLEQEQIEVVDAVARLQPPVVDFSAPLPEWHAAAGDAFEMFRWIRHQYQNQFNPTQWPRNRMEQRELRWIPFPSSLGRINLKESAGDDGVLQQLLGGRTPGALPTSADYVWKQDGFHIFSQHDDDEELPLPCEKSPLRLSMNDPDESVMGLIRKRRITQTMEEDPVSPESPTIGVKSRRLANHTNIAHGALGEGLLLGQHESNAAEKLLSNFMNLRAAKRQMSTTSGFASAPAARALAASDPTTSKRTTHKTTPQAPILRPDIRAVSVEAPCPPMEHSNNPPRIFISVTLPRHIISALRAKMPGIDLVDRDFTRYNTWAWSPGSTRRVELQSPLSFEADVTPSPATGIILTTILKVRQKPLPGSKTQTSQLRERVMKVAPLYERLIVLVSEGQPAGEQVGPLSEADAKAYASFVAFACSVCSRCSVRVMYVAGGSQTLADWTCALVSTHAKEASSDVQQIIMSEETEWEVFLRRAGFNMFAAQVALAVVKGMHPADDEGQTLVRFLGMSPAERAGALQRFLGCGRGLVDRVSACLS